MAAAKLPARLHPTAPSWLATLALLAVTASLSACSTKRSTAADGGGVRVVAAENVWGNIAAQISGGKVSVTSIITNPNADPHLYDGDPRTASAVGQASVVITNGLGYDDFMTKLLSSGSNAHRQLITVATTLSLSGHNTNPHLWYLTARLPDVASAIASALSVADPADTVTFQANRARFVAGLAPVLRTIEQIKAKYSGVPVAYTERVAGYLVNAAGLVVASPTSFAQSIEDGNEPSPGDTAAMTTLITGHRIRALLYNSQVTSPVTERIRALATANGIPVVGVAETLPTQFKDFQSWQLAQTTALLAALGG